jgi:hypothetical protein
LTTRRPIFSGRAINQRIGYLEGGKAYDLAGRLRCHYNDGTGNLGDLETGKIVGHISLEGRFVGSSWLAAELFPTKDAELFPTKDSVPIASRPDHDGGVENGRSNSSDADIERALEMVRATLGQS